MILYGILHLRKVTLFLVNLIFINQSLNNMFPKKNLVHEHLFKRTQLLFNNCGN